MITASTAEDQARAQTALRAAFDTPPATVSNVASVLDLETSSLFEFHGRLYVVKPLSWKDGLVLQKLWHRLEALRRAPNDLTAVQELYDLMQAFVGMVKSLVKPKSWATRLIWRWHNPFEQCTEQELGEIMGFFSACRMKSSIKFLAENQDPPRQLLTRLMTSPSSSGIFLRGATPQDSPSPGDTMSTA